MTDSITITCGLCKEAWIDIRKPIASTLAEAVDYALRAGEIIREQCYASGWRTGYSDLLLCPDCLDRSTTCVLCGSPVTNRAYLVHVKMVHGEAS